MSVCVCVCVRACVRVCVGQNICREYSTTYHKKNECNPEDPRIDLGRWEDTARQYANLSQWIINCKLMSERTGGYTRRLESLCIDFGCSSVLIY